MSTAIVRRQRKTLLQEIELSSGRLSFRVPRLITCHLCHQPAICLYADEETPGGACLSCKLGEEYLKHLEERDASDAESCCMCGCD